MNVASVERGASDDQISRLPSWKYKQVDNNLGLGDDSNHNLVLANEDKVSRLTTDGFTKLLVLYFAYPFDSWLNYRDVLFLHKTPVAP